ncbi:MAG: DUF1080 domain-containing protein [Planctomycetia bacterium]|nr:DUF1080 domain-containing protein [Planctomycetia bacterium]
MISVCKCLAILFASALLLVAAVPLSAEEPKDKEWVKLFNGKNLDGWTPKIKGYELGDNHADTFRVEDGVIKVAYDKYKDFEGKFGHLFYKEKFSHYRLKVEYRFVGEQCKGGPAWATRNSGVMLHSQDPKSMRKDQDFPVSIEAQFLGGLGKGNRPTCNMCSPGTHIVLNGKLFTTHCTNSKSKTFAGDVWVTAEIEVNGGGTVKHFVNGELVLEYEKPQLDAKDADAKKLIKDGKVLLEEGYIALQAESHPVEFRTVEIKVRKK